MNLQIPVWFNFFAILFPLVISIWLFLQGYINIKTNRATNFGFDAFFIFLENINRKQVKPDDLQRKDNRRFRLMGIKAIIVGFIMASSAIVVFYILSANPG